jgi:hypothetical protein
MLAYVFWHAPAEGVDTVGYERALLAFHRSLARTPPFGFEGSAAVRIGAWPWASGGVGPAGASMPPPVEDRPASALYEDWYLIEDFAALGVLGAAAVGRGHRTSHDRAAKGLGGGTAGVYRLIEGELASAAPIAACAHATWVAPARGADHSALGAMLGDGTGARDATLWQRQLVLGPAPEFCALASSRPAGAAPARLPDGWSVTEVSREPLAGA